MDEKQEDLSPYLWIKSKCCNCGNVIVDTGTLRTNMEWTKFYLLARENYFPKHISFCENCRAYTVFDLLALAGASNGKE